MARIQLVLFRFNSFFFLNFPALILLPCFCFVLCICTVRSTQCELRVNWVNGVFLFGNSVDNVGVGYDELFFLFCTQKFQTIFFYYLFTLET